MTINLIQYAPAFVAVGCKLNYVSIEGQLHIGEYPKDKKIKPIIDAAIEDIEKYEDTSNFKDGVSVLALPDFIDGTPNPIPLVTRNIILTSLGLLIGDKFNQQILMRDKVNHSWHISEETGKCTLFGEICTNRGVEKDPHKRGRKATRSPQEYHRWTSRGVSREQLVTPNVEKLYRLIPQERWASKNKTTLPSPEILQNLPKEELERFLINIKEIING